MTREGEHGLVPEIRAIAYEAQPYEWLRTQQLTDQCAVTCEGKYRSSANGWSERCHSWKTRLRIKREHAPADQSQAKYCRYLVRGSSPYLTLMKQRSRVSKCDNCAKKKLPATRRQEVKSSIWMMLDAI